MSEITVRDFLSELDEPVLEILPEVTVQPSKLLLQESEQSILEFMLKGLSIEDIALRMGMTTAMVRSIVTRKDMQEELRVMTESLDELRISRLKGILESVIDARLDEVENPGEATKKDLLDVLKVYQDLLSSEKKSRKPTEEQNIYVNILNQVME